MLTLFSCPREFIGPFDAIQRNAIESWLDSTGVEVMLLGEPDSKAGQVAEAYGLPFYRVAVNEHNTPLVSSIFAVALAEATTRLTCYINADIIVVGPLGRAAQICADRFDRFLMIGQRTDLDLNGWRLNRRVDWRGCLRQMIADRGVLHKPCGIDYFCTTGDVWGEMPGFALGRAAWDNWLVARPLRDGVPIVDATQFVTIVHQQHPVVDNSRERPECKANYRMLDEAGTGHGGVQSAQWVLTAEGQIQERRK